MIKTLLLDLETAPNRVFTWGLFNQNIAINQIDKPGYILCWAAKWLGTKEMIFSSIHNNPRISMLTPIYALLEEADSVIHYNGTKFDLPTLHQEFLRNDFGPPAPTIEIDLLRTVRRKFRLPSNKLAFVAEYLGVGSKMKNSGFELWRGCMAEDPKAWAEMKRYNIQDVLLLEKVYNVLLPWIPNHPNQGLFVDSTAILCPRCGNTSITKRGFAYTKTQVYQRYQCGGCGSWSRARSTSLPMDRRKKILTDTV